jgi:hypothetical protein
LWNAAALPAPYMDSATIDSATVARVIPVVRANIVKESHFMSDEARHY